MSLLKSPHKWRAHELAALPESSLEWKQNPVGQDDYNADDNDHSEQQVSSSSNVRLASPI